MRSDEENMSDKEGFSHLGETSVCTWLIPAGILSGVKCSWLGQRELLKALISIKQTCINTEKSRV